MGTVQAGLGTIRSAARSNHLAAPCKLFVGLAALAVTALVVSPAQAELLFDVVVSDGTMTQSGSVSGTLNPDGTFSFETSNVPSEILSTPRWLFDDFNG